MNEPMLEIELGRYYTSTILKFWKKHGKPLGSMWAQPVLLDATYTLKIRVFDPQQAAKLADCINGL